jgi:adenine phosphoribosyltransferase
VDLRSRIRSIPDFPRPGIVFRDVTPLFGDRAALGVAIEQLAAWGAPLKADLVLAAEARGFILGCALAHRLGAAFVPARKAGKLPYDTISAQYALEYGFDALEIHTDAIPKGARVLVHDDLLATGGTAGAMCDLVAAAGAEVVGCAFLVELSFLAGRARLGPQPVHALVDYPAE